MPLFETISTWHTRSYEATHEDRATTQETNILLCCKFETAALYAQCQILCSPDERSDTPDGKRDSLTDIAVRREAIHRLTGQLAGARGGAPGIRRGPLSSARGRVPRKGRSQPSLVCRHCQGLRLLAMPCAAEARCLAAAAQEPRRGPGGWGCQRTGRRLASGRRGSQPCPIPQT